MTRPSNSLLIVLDTNLLVQWAIRPTEPQHALQVQFERGGVALAVDGDLLAEYAKVLSRDGVAQRIPLEEKTRLHQLSEKVVRLGERIEDVPRVFHHPSHPKDDHLYNLAIAARADAIVTNEKRHCALRDQHPKAWAELQELAPGLRIEQPKVFLTALREQAALAPLLERHSGQESGWPRRVERQVNGKTLAMECANPEEEQAFQRAPICAKLDNATKQAGPAPEVRLRQFMDTEVLDVAGQDLTQQQRLRMK